MSDSGDDAAGSRRGVVLAGVPWDGDSSFQRGPAEAPPRIRAALHSPAGNLTTEAGRDLGAPGILHDAGDWAATAKGTVHGTIEAWYDEVLALGLPTIALGGDHSVSAPLIRAAARQHGPLTILHLDAHPDLYEQFGGSRTSHASPFARVLEEGLCGRLVQVGIRASTPHQREQATRYGVPTIGVDRWQEAAGLVLEGPVYLSLDLDVLDPAFAPGLSHPEPGGLSTRQVLEIVHRLDGCLVAADVVEYNPRNDVHDLTARVAAKLVKEIAGRMLE